MKRKGITPVIAVVLLLLITVGAVASAWGLYQNIISDQSQLDELNAQQRASNTDLSIRTVTESGDGDMEIYIQNTGSRAINLTDELEMDYSPGDEDGYLPLTALDSEYKTGTANCLPEETLSVGNTTSCDTGVTFPDATDEMSIRINYKNADSAEWTYECRPSTSSTTTC